MGKEWSRLQRLGDLVPATLLGGGIGWNIYRTIFLTPESDNTIAYSLPDANLVERGVLAI